MAASLYPGHTWSGIPSRSGSTLRHSDHQQGNVSRRGQLFGLRGYRSRPAASKRSLETRLDRWTRPGLLCSGFGSRLDQRRSGSPPDSERNARGECPSRRWAAGAGRDPACGRYPRVNSAALFTDFYELTMLQAYFDEGMNDLSAFDLFVRRLPPTRNYLVACGLEHVLEYLERFSFSSEGIEYLRSLHSFSDAFLDSLHAFKFTGDVYAVPEGTVVFPNEPIIEVVAPLPEAQIIETFLMNQIQVGTLAASKAARVVHAARGRQVVDFGVRRMHGADAGVKEPRAFYIAGVDATSNVLAGQNYGIPLAGTMAHSYVQAFDDEIEAFRHFIRAYPTGVILVDTYDIRK